MQSLFLLLKEIFAVICSRKSSMCEPSTGLHVVVFIEVIKLRVQWLGIKGLILIIFLKENNLWPSFVPISIFFSIYLWYWTAIAGFFASFSEEKLSFNLTLAVKYVSAAVTAQCNSHGPNDFRFLLSYSYELYFLTTAYLLRKLNWLAKLKSHVHDMIVYNISPSIHPSVGLSVHDHLSIHQQIHFSGTQRISFSVHASFDQFVSQLVLVFVFMYVGCTEYFIINCFLSTGTDWRWAWWWWKHVHKTRKGGTASKIWSLHFIFFYFYQWAYPVNSFKKSSAQV